MMAELLGFFELCGEVDEILVQCIEFCSDHRDTLGIQGFPQLGELGPIDINADKLHHRAMKIRAEVSRFKQNTGNSFCLLWVWRENLKTVGTWGFQRFAGI